VLALLPKLPKLLSGPKYSGNYLRTTLGKLLGETKLRQTLTNVVIPTFDIKTLQPTIFSSYQVSIPNTTHMYILKSKVLGST